MNTDFDIVVIGAGFAGMRMLHTARQFGLSAHAFEAGPDVGGTWYWNRYPNARTDSEAWVYCYSFDEALQQEWDWTERFPGQAEVLSYLRHVADRFDLRRDISFGTRIQSAVYDEEAARWTVTDENGETATGRYFVPASGLMSIAYLPPFEDIDTFGGELYSSSSWPDHEVDFTGKRVALIGTGATGVQLAPAIAASAAHLTVFQRTPNYVLPSRNHALEDWQRAEIKARYPAIWARTKEHYFGFPFEDTSLTAADVTADEHQRMLEWAWETGTFRFMFEAFADMITDSRSNAVASEFVRNKIRAIVKDPETAELLCPKTYPLGMKRPPLGHFYYETFNRPNVSLVSVRDNPIERLTPSGLGLADGTVHEFDMIVFATGFDAMTGALTSIDVRGRNGRSLREEWAPGPRTYLGIAAEGFPNMFMVVGPQSPFANIPVVIESHIDFIRDAIEHAEKSGSSSLEVTQEAAEGWNAVCEFALNATVVGREGDARSWFLGSNLPGKTPSVLMFFGGMKPYLAALRQETDSGFASFTIHSPDDGPHGD
jgi:cyclohexanone monooxygenase